MSADLGQNQGDELLDGPGELFKKIRNHISTSQGQGQVFERLIKAFLKEDPLFKERFKQVWLWSEWPGRQGEHDSGIDLVAEESDGGVCAIQCKFYGENKYIGRSDIDTFLARSGKEPFTTRLFVSTTEHWSSTAEKVLADQRVPVQRIGIAELEESPFDWSRFDPANPDQLFKHTPKEVRPHQRKAIDDVKSGFETTDRGKLIMACGTGKTFTALRLAEEIVPSGGLVLFCVPSISLLSQTLRAWTSDATRPLHAMAVCSDAQVTRDSEDMHIYDLALPATTSPEKIVEHLRLAKAESENEENPLLVVFSTYQSLDRIAEAQEQGAPVFDLVIADEAHRTTGSRLVGEDDTGFTIIHNNQSIQSKRRLYMTATPRLYSDKAKKQAKESDVVLCSMDDEKLYGPVFHHLGFGEAVDQSLLSDYRVIILMVDEEFVSKIAHEPLADSDIELVLQDAARLVGVWRGLSKQETSREQLKGDGFDYDPAPMRRAVAFSTTIAASKQIQRTLPTVVDSIRNQEEKGVVCEAEHVDGTMGAQEREQKLAWLREDPPDGVCRVLTNARCLSEGVDVPALDAVIFIQPRKSQIDVVQAVGRVMRRAEGKKYGYVIIPVAVPAGEDPERVLDDNKRYKVVWQVLQALRAHDDRFDAEINKLDLQKNYSGRIQVVGVGGNSVQVGNNTDYRGHFADAWQGLEDKVYARVVKHCGTRTYWEDWAKNVAHIASSHITRISTAIASNDTVSRAFESYLAGLHKTINPSVTKDEAIEMLAQHLITYPVFEALFGNSSFVTENPVSRSMADVWEQLHEEEAIAQERAELAEFYSSVRTSVEGIDNLESRQNVIKELYEKFFQRAFPKVADRLGIVYTPTEIIDFMLKSVNQALSDEFNTKLGAKNVHILDPFTGTGTFLVKLLSLLDKRDIQRTYNEFLHVCPDGAVRRGVDRGRPGLARRLMYELNEVRMRNPRPSVASIGFRDRVRAPRNAQVVDLFCGCGGMSLGFLANGYRLAGGADLNETAVRTYAENLAPAFVRDVRDLVGDESELKSFLAGLPDFDPAAPTVLVGGPPCQGFTAHRKRSWDVPDPRNDLVSVFARAAVLMLPDAVAMENVPELLSARYRPYFDSFRSVLEAAGYVVRAGIVNAATFGVPQERFRAVVVAMRSGRFGLPSPRLTPERFATVRDAIGDLPPVEAGVAHPSDPMHRSAAHRASTIATLRAVPRDGGSRPPGTGPACLDRVAGYYDVYGRLAWGRPSITITHYARNPASGRFAHPEQDRGLTMRETARLQGFPDWFRFSGSFDQVFGQIGEAVPPPLARGIAEAVSAGLAGRVLRGAAEEALEPVSDSYGGVIAAQKMRRAGRSAGV